jgi:hypothetical protein
MVVAEPEVNATTRDYRFEYVRVADLKIDSSYHAAERFSEKHVWALGSFDESKVGVITCSFRDGSTWLLDGNHRRALARDAGVEMLYAKVFFGKSQAEEARIFHGLSRQLALQGIDLWQTRRVERDPIVVGIESILELHGIAVVRSNANQSPHATKAIGILERIYINDPALLSETLDVLQKVWPTEGRSLSGVPLQGLSSFLYVYRRTIPTMKETRLLERLSLITPEELIRLESSIRGSATGRYGTGGGIGSSPGGAIGRSGKPASIVSWSYPRNAVLAIYNRGLHHRLLAITQADMRQIADGIVVNLRDRET